MADRPKVASPGKGIVTVADLLKAPGTLERFKRFAPKVVDPARLFSVSALAINRAPKLLQASPSELMQALMHVTSLGLEINSPRGHAYLIPFEVKGKVTIQVIIGYRGLTELMFRSGQISAVEADVVTVGEISSGLFEYEKGLTPKLKHVYARDRDEDKDAAAFAYCVVQMKDGTRRFEVMPWTAIERIRNGSSGYQFAKSKGTKSAAYTKNPWVAHEWEMAKKTVVRRIAKLLPISAELAAALETDEGSEREDFDLGAVMDLDPSSWGVLDPEKKTSKEPESGAGSDEDDQGGSQAAEEAPGAEEGAGEAETAKATKQAERAESAQTPEESKRAVPEETTEEAERAVKHQETEQTERAEGPKPTDQGERASDSETPVEGQRAEEGETTRESERATETQTPSESKRPDKPQDDFWD